MGRKAKYIVRLEPQERQTLLDLVRTGRRSAAVLTHARILLQADAGDRGPSRDDAAVAAATEASVSTVYRVRQAFVEHGVDAALHRKRPTGRQYRKLDGAQEARLVAVACSKPPAGRSRWTLRLLADRLVELEVVESISPECVRATLKKTRCSPGARSNG
jgi:transposase